jgi:hypothetical protein
MGIAVVSAEIQAEHLQNTSKERYRCGQPGRWVQLCSLQGPTAFSEFLCVSYRCVDVVSERNGVVCILGQVLLLFNKLDLSYEQGHAMN